MILAIMLDEDLLMAELCGVLAELEIMQQIGFLSEKIVILMVMQRQFGDNGGIVKWTCLCD